MRARLDDKQLHYANGRESVPVSIVGLFQKSPYSFLGSCFGIDMHREVSSTSCIDIFALLTFPRNMAVYFTDVIDESRWNRSFDAIHFSNSKVVG